MTFRKEIAESSSTANGEDILQYINACSKGFTWQGVEENIAAAFLNRLVKWVKNIKVCDPFEEGCRLGPVISQGQHEKLLKFIATAKSEGATILCGGSRPEPTIVSDFTTSMQIWREEIFRLALCVKTFSSETEAGELANDSTYGLGGAVISKDLDKCERLTKLV